MSILLLYILLSYGPFAKDQQCVKWSEAKNFYFYQLPRGTNTERIKWSDIEKIDGIKINEAASILSRSECKSPRITLWKDEYMLVVEFIDGKKRKFKVSGYGGFLYEPGQRFYFVQDKDKDKWQSIIQESRAKNHKK
jgi:hypothetical protein